MGGAAGGTGDADRSSSVFATGTANPPATAALSSDSSQPYNKRLSQSTYSSALINAVQLLQR